MSDKKNLNVDDLTCKPIYSYEEVFSFLDNPPAWRSLCIQLKPHSEYAIKNIELNENCVKNSQTSHFCHINVDRDFEVKRHEEKHLAKTLVCHDMANGYHDDSFVNGTGNYDAYNFYNWSAIDIFCYFSHHFITIPPLSWINVGHTHGVKVIGTVITEWSDGARLWETILKTKQEWQRFASALAAIAKCMRFDGWLLNIENNISKPEELLKFVTYLHKVLHDEVPGSLLIWYDSVTVTGHLNWQNGLNENNRAFFDATDGIFTNYTWTEDHIRSSVAAAGARLNDLYIGIDVWGRNFYGGGEFNTAAAVRVAHKHGCSLAIFAQAWTHEAIKDSKDPLKHKDIPLAESLDRYDHFLLRDRALWGSLWPHLNTRLPCHLPFRTSFCRGHGKKKWMYGEIMSLNPWYNLRHMQYQLNSAQGTHGYILTTGVKLHEAYSTGVINDNNGVVLLRKTFQRNVDYVEAQYEMATDSYVQITDDENAAVDGKDSDTKDLQITDETDSKLMKETKSVVDNTQRKIILISVPEEKECFEYYMRESFIGGSCIKVNPSDRISIDHRTSRLFHCDFHVDEAIIACVATKKLKDNDAQYLNVILETVNCNNDKGKVVLIGEEMSMHQTGSTDANFYPVNENMVEFRDLQRYLMTEEPDFYVPVANSNEWLVRYYEAPLPGHSITSIYCRTAEREGSILLGHFGLCPRRTVSAE